MKENKNILTVRVRKPWEISKGHTPHRSGAGTHVSGVKRERTRFNQKQAAIKDQY
jgi:hypothetical protein